MRRMNVIKLSRVAAVVSVLYIAAACAGVPGTVFEYERTGREQGLDYTFTGSSEPYLKELADFVDLGSIIADAGNDLERTALITGYVSGLWNHDSRNTPSSNDPLTILREVKEGERFRCVEYSIVLHGLLSALDIPCRFINLRQLQPELTNDAHVVCEVFLRDLRRWILVDPQWNRIPIIREIPASTVELQQAVASADSNISYYGKGRDSRYTRWMARYLVYMHTNPDCRVGVTSFNHKNILLVPVNAPIPAYLSKWHAENKYEISRSSIVTNNIDLFYSPPVSR